MSNLNISISNSEVIPQLESCIFANNNNAQYAVGVLAVGDTVRNGLDREYLSYLKLRASVYADQTNMISKDLVNQDGTENDEDDVRATHFAVIENGVNFARVVASMRLIVKSATDERALPIESFFPNAFDEPAPLGSIEVSRYICRHENKKTQRDLKWPLYRSVLTYIMQNRLSPTYAVVEPILERGLTMSGVPNKRIADPQFIEEYSDENLAIVIDTNGLAANMGITLGSVPSSVSKKFEFFGNLGDRI